MSFFLSSDSLVKSGGGDSLKAKLTILQTQVLLLMESVADGIMKYRQWKNNSSVGLLFIFWHNFYI